MNNIVDGDTVYLYQPKRQKSPSAHHTRRVILIAGPTATGKSKLAIDLARRMKGEIISADSMQAYRGMNIGTAKVTFEEMANIPHHLIDIKELSETFNVVDFCEMACAAIEDIQRRGLTPIVVGGTGFYHHALIYGPPQGPPASPEIRARLVDEAEAKGWATLYANLQHLDPEYAKTVDPNDSKKIARALEIIELTEKKVSDFALSESPIPPPDFDFRCWFLYHPREILYPRIEMRCDQMIAHGFPEEVEELLEKGLRDNPTASRAIGYRQYLDYLNKEGIPQDWEDFVWAFKQASRHYAKRQFTWFRKEHLFRWINLDEHPPAEALSTILSDACS